MLKYYFPFNKNKFGFQLGHYFSPIPKNLKDLEKWVLEVCPPKTTYWRKCEKTRENWCKKSARFFCPSLMLKILLISTRGMAIVSIKISS